MAKRRNKDKAKRRFAGLDRKVQINGDIAVQKIKMDAKTKQEPKTECYKVNDPGEKVQVTESGILTDSVKENKKEMTRTDQQKIRKPKGRKSSKNTHKMQQKTVCLGDQVHDATATEEVLVFPTEIDGETCLEIKCGNNEAQMYLSKLCLGSKGACIHYCDSWLTPNEFQTVSGRETAKDWKRSIRHNGRSLKMLISKGLITIQNVAPKKTQVFSTENPNCHIDPVTSSFKRESSIEAAKDDEKSSVGENDTAFEQKIKPETKPIPRKRGRKPKRLRQRNVRAKTQSRDKEENASDVAGTSSFEELGNGGQKLTDESKIGSEVAEEERLATDDEPEATTAQPEDTRTEEERRLDEFVKSLRLTKAVAPKSGPDSSLLEKAKNAPESTDSVLVDPEMPVLQKEADIIPIIPTKHADDHIDANVDIDTFHATVTPPPTPPGDKIIIDRKTDDEKLIETFKSRLASPSNGLKLTINREKVKVDNTDSKDNVNKPTNELYTGQNSTKPNIQSLLLQDALQSAKKYKEQLKQNSHTMPCKSIIQIPSMKLEECKNAENALPRCIPSPVIQRTSDSQRKAAIQKPVSKNIPRDQYSSQQVSQPKTRSLSCLPAYSAPSVEDLNTGRMSFQDLLAVMSSLYGPLPFPVDTKDAALAALQEMHRRQDILRFLTQGQVDGSSPSVLHPVQQLYSLCNIPGWLPSTKPSTVSSKPQTSEIQRRQTMQAFDIRHGWIPQTPDVQYKNDKLKQDIPPQRTSHSQEIQHRRTPHSQEIQHQRIPYSQEIHHRRIHHSQEIQHRHTLHSQDVQNRRTPHSQEFHNQRISQVQQDMLHRKRNNSEVVNECALDLSLKRQKVEHVSSTKSINVNDANCLDVPIDFSMKTTKDFDQCPAKKTYAMNETISTPRNFENKRSSATYTDVIPKPSMIMCTCDSERKDDITTWTVEHVCFFLKDLDGCAPYAKTFHEQGISGKLLPYLTTQHLTKTLGMKVGPALTLMQAVERKFKERHVMSSSSPCQRCRIHQQSSLSC